GQAALTASTTGSLNTAVRPVALFENTTGNHNTAVGSNALISNTTGNNNLALGTDAGKNLSAGDYNVYISNAGLNGETGAIRIGTTGTPTSLLAAGVRGVTTGTDDATP